jgi:hypothetical protein
MKTHSLKFQHVFTQLSSWNDDSISFELNEKLIEKWITALMLLKEKLIDKIFITEQVSVMRLTIERHEFYSLQRTMRKKKHIHIASVLYPNDKEWFFSATENDLDCIINWYLYCTIKYEEYKKLVLDIQCESHNTIMFSVRSE